jgi:exodeoxyribonuclease V gamma subunit
LNAAECTLYLSYCGKHPRDDTDQAPSSLISELLDCLAAMHPQQKDFREKFVVQHPLQVFSGNEVEDPRRLRFDPAWNAIPSKKQEVDVRFIRAQITDEASDEHELVLQWQDIKRFFKHPAKYFLQERLGLHLAGQEEKLDEHEPFGSNGGLPRYQLRHAVFNALIADGQPPDDQELLTRLRSLALLPSGFSAEPVLYKTLSEVKRQATRFKAWRSGEARNEKFELRLGRFVIQGSLDNCYPQGVARIVLGEMQGRHHCSHGLDALLLSALGNQNPLMEFAEIKKDSPLQRTRPTHDSAQAKNELNDLLELFVSGQKQPLPFYPDTGFTYLKNLREQNYAFNEKAWEKASEAAPENDIWWTTALRGQNPFIDHADQPESFPASLAFRDISLKVFHACAPEFIGGTGDDDD